MKHNLTKIIICENIFYKIFLGAWLLSKSEGQIVEVFDKHELGSTNKVALRKGSVGEVKVKPSGINYTVGSESGEVLVYQVRHDSEGEVRKTPLPDNSIEVVAVNDKKTSSGRSKKPKKAKSKKDKTIVDLNISPQKSFSGPVKNNIQIQSIREFHLIFILLYIKVEF